MKKHSDQLRAQVLDAIRAGSTVLQASEDFGVPRRTVRRWVAKAGVTAPVEGPPPTALRRQAAHVDNLQADDRDRLVKTVRDLHAAMASTAAKLRKAAEGDEEPTLSRDTSQAMAQLARAAQTLIDAHPGLLAVVASGKAEAEDQDAKIKRLRKAFGLDDPRESAEQLRRLQAARDGSAPGGENDDVDLEHLRWALGLPEDTP